MKVLRASERRALDRRLAGLDQAVGIRPFRGWIRTIRGALGMTTFDLAMRMGVTQPRASQLERAEVNGSIKLESLERAAAAMRCRLCYVFVPEEPLVSMVHRQARAKAVAELDAAVVEAGREGREGGEGGEGREGDAPDPDGTDSMDGMDELDELDELVEERAYELIDSLRLWQQAEPGSVSP